MHSKADLLAGIPPPKPVLPKRPRPLLKRRYPARKPVFRGARSGFMGVILASRCKIRPWKAYIRNCGVYLTIGYFATREEAARAYNEYALRLHGPGTYQNPV